MVRPIIVTAANIKFKFYIQHLIQSIVNQKYSYIVYDLGELGQGCPFLAKVSEQPFKTIPAKPYIIHDALGKIGKDEFVVWVDADTLLMDNIDEIVGEYDIGVTIRKERGDYCKMGTINAGVIFIRNTKEAKLFLQIWGEKSMELEGDQWALNELCDFSTEEIGKTKNIFGAVIKSFPCTVYNNFYFTEEQHHHAKIFHYKTDFRDKYPHKIYDGKVLEFP